MNIDVIVLKNELKIRIQFLSKEIVTVIPLKNVKVEVNMTRG